MRQIKDTFTKKNLIRIEQWARNGLTVEQIAKNLNIARRSFYNHLQKNEELKQVLDTGREVADVEVENALYKSATGYYINEEYVDSHGTVKTFKKYVQPNTTAQIFWLKNRKPKQWREKQEIEVENVEKVQLIIKNDL